MKAKKHNAALTRTSAFREDRKNYLTASGYTYYRWDEDLKKEVPVHIGLGEEYTEPDGTVRTIDREILILLDSIDHDENVEQDEPEEITEYSEVLVRRMIERITVYDDCFVVEFKSGIEITINE